MKLIEIPTIDIIMYKLIVRNQKESGEAIFYDHKMSKMNWYIGSPIKDKIILDIETNNIIDDFIISLKTNRKIESLEKYNKFKEECF